MEYNENGFDDKELLHNVAKYENAVKQGDVIYMEPDELTDVAEFFYKQGNIQKAIEAINYATSIFPHATMPLIFRARIALLDEKDIELAKKVAKDVGDKTELDYLYLIAEIKIAEKRPDDADKYLHQHLEMLLDEDKPDFILDVATLFADYNLYDFAEQWLSLSEETDLSDYQELKGRIASIKGNYSESEQIFESLLDKNPFSNHNWNNLALSQMMQDRIKDSITSSEYSIAINPKDDEALMNKANGLYNLALFEEALEYYKRYSVIRPNDYVGYLCQGNTLLNINRSKEAIDCYQKALKLVGKNEEGVSDLYQQLAFALIAVGKYDEARQYVAKYEQLPDADKADVLVIKGYICLEESNLIDANNYFKEALKTSNYDKMTYLLIGISYYDCDYYHIAKTWLEVVAKSEENEYDECYAYLASCYRHLGMVKEFQTYLKKACEIDPTEVKIVFSQFLPDDIEPKDYYKHISEIR